MKRAIPTTPSRPTTPISQSGIGQRVDERHHGSGGEIQKRWGAIRVVEHIAERPCERSKVGQQARRLLWSAANKHLSRGSGA